MLPRLYQNAVFEESSQRNIVARIDTGGNSPSPRSHRSTPLPAHSSLPAGGKTLCAILLIKHIASQLKIDDSTDQHSLIVFIVPTVSLVHQQAEVVRTQTNLRVKEYIGSMGQSPRRNVGTGD